MKTYTLSLEVYRRRWWHKLLGLHPLDENDPAPWWRRWFAPTVVLFEYRESTSADYGAGPVQSCFDAARRAGYTIRRIAGVRYS